VAAVTAVCALELSFAIRRPETRGGLFRSLYVFGNRFLSLSNRRRKTACHVEYLIAYTALFVSVLFTAVLVRAYVIVRDHGYDFAVAFFAALLSVNRDNVDDDLFFNDGDTEDDTDDDLGSDSDTSTAAV